MLMIESETLGGDKVLVSYSEARRAERSLRACNERRRELRRQWHEERGEAEGADPFACFE